MNREVRRSPNGLRSQSRSLSIENSQFMSKVYMWMTLGVLMTGLVAYYISTKPELIALFFSNRILSYAVMFAPVIFSFFLYGAIRKLSFGLGLVSYFAFAVILGISLSTIFLAYNLGTIQNAFYITAGSFAGLSIFGYVTKIDLKAIGSFCIMGFFGLFAIGMLSFVFPGMLSGQFGYIYNIACVAIFSGLTAYQTQKIKEMKNGSGELNKMALLGAFTLYISFINLFMSILRLMSRD